jgi:small subunit ribosomal protein S4
MELSASAVTPDWLELDAAKLSAKLVRIPSQEEIAPIVNVQLIVEFYSR